MGVSTRSRVSSDCENWDKIFKGLVKMLRTKQDQLESLVNERKILEDRIKMQYDRWVSDVRLYEDHISQMKHEADTMAVMQSFETAKWDLFAGFKSRELNVCKWKLESTEDELDDFRNWFNHHTKLLNLSKDNVNADDHPSVEDEIKRLRIEYEKICSEKNTEVSALLRENGFAWFQFKRMETELTDKIKTKDDEIVKANEKISSLVSHQEQLLANNQGKDETIERLKAELAGLQDDCKKKDAEILKLSKELNSTKRSRSSSLTPVFRRCSMDKTGNGGRNNVDEIKKLSGAIIPISQNQAEKRSRNSRRKQVDDDLMSRTPGLFNSSFKVPKLKIPSPLVQQSS